MRRRLSALRNELALLLSADDPRWYHFGFNRPADRRIPALVTNVSVVPAGLGALQVRWDPSSLADNYRVTRQIQELIKNL